MLRAEADWVVKETAQEIDAALALANQHHQVIRVRVGSRRCFWNLALLTLVTELPFVA